MEVTTRYVGSNLPKSDGLSGSGLVSCRGMGTPPAARSQPSLFHRRQATTLGEQSDVVRVGNQRHRRVQAV